MSIQENLPPDPEGMNEDRASWAQIALDAFAAKTGSEPGHEAFCDLLADLRHWCDRNGEDFDVCAKESAQVYAEETLEWVEG